MVGDCCVNFFLDIYYKLSVMVYIPSYIVEKLDALSVYDVAEKLGLTIADRIVHTYFTLSLIKTITIPV